MGSEKRRAGGVGWGRGIFRFLLPAFFFFAACFGFTQEEGFFYIERAGEETRFIQHLAWEGQEYAYRYEVFIEKRETAGFRQVAREFTFEPFVEVSLAPGEYRFGIVVYDLFDAPGETPPWTYFEILPALQPELRDFKPEIFYLDEDTVWVISLDGRNLAAGAEVYLLLQGTRDKVIIPTEYTPSPSGNSGQLVFVLSKLTPGSYDVYVKNPGGLDTALGTFRIAYRKPFDFNVSLGYAPLFSLYGALNDFFDKQVFPLGAAARISFVPFKRVWGYLGVELVPFWTHLSMQADGYDLVAQFVGIQANLFFQKWLTNRMMAFNFRLGAGMVLLDNLHFEYSRGSSESLRTLMPSLGAGASFMWFVKKPFFLEIGAEYMHFFSVDNPSLGYIRPILGGGWRF